MIGAVIFAGVGLYGVSFTGRGSKRGMCWDISLYTHNTKVLSTDLVIVRVRLHGVVMPSCPSVASLEGSQSNVTVDFVVTQDTHDTINIPTRCEAPPQLETWPFDLGFSCLPPLDRYAASSADNCGSAARIPDIRQSEPC